MISPAGASALVGVTLFNIDAESLEQVCLQWAGLELEKWAFDNSDEMRRSGNAEICARLGINYHPAMRNVGTAGALNWFTRQARRSGLEWVLYFDQDSRLRTPKDGADWGQIPSVHPEVAVVGSGPVQPGDVAASRASGTMEVESVIASGTAFRAEAVASVGGFDEGLFLDGVDHEMCLRLRQAGWKVVVDRGRTIHHVIGDSPRSSGWVIRRRLTRHPWWRRRAMARNVVVIWRRYRSFDAGRCDRYLLGRVLDSMMSAVVFRDFRYISTAVLGIAEGMRADVTRSDWIGDGS